MSSPLEFIPAIDLRAGQAVRLLRGDYAAETRYGDPLALCARYLEAGATRVHVVDLDAARSGEAVNAEVVRRLAAQCAAAGVALQVGGGVRDTARAVALLDSGVDRVVLGTAALADPGLAHGLAQRFPGHIAVGLDHRRNGAAREVAVEGWTKGSGLTLDEALARFASSPLAAVIVTDISRDGTLEGPDLAGYEAVLAAGELPVIASGGVGSLADLEALRRVEVNGKRLAGVIVGRALLSGAIGLEEAVAACTA